MWSSLGDFSTTCSFSISIEREKYQYSFLFASFTEMCLKRHEQLFRNAIKIKSDLFQNTLPM